MNYSKQSDLVAKALKDPGAIYGAPGNVLNDTRLNAEEKHAILESWALDQRRLMESEDENMTQVPGGRPSAASLYQDILAADRKLHH